MKQGLFIWFVVAAAHVALQAASTPTFFWDFETETPNICSGGACVPHYAANAARSTEQAADGTWSLKNQGAWSQGGVTNESNNHIWAPMTEGTVEFDWQYVAPFSQRMLFQFSGRWGSSSYDHNDGVKLTVRFDNQLRMEMGYGTVSNSYKTVTVRANLSSALADGQWYHVICRYKQNVGLELTFDGQTFTQSNALDSIITADRAWHLIVMGNDLDYACTQYLDNFTVYDHWTTVTAIKDNHAIRQSKPDVTNPAASQAGLFDVRGKQVNVRNVGSGIYYTYDQASGRVVKTIIMQ